MSDRSVGVLVVCGVLLLLLSIPVYLFGSPYYNVWTAEMRGKAILAEAENARRAEVAKAQAELEAASLEVQAIAVLGEAYQNNPDFRYMKFIDAFAEGMKNGSIQKVIYVPTEAQIPIMEARSEVLVTPAK
jgi:regulator of protease activity HflC (stomatin/prohibitin superfamily)